MRESKIQILGTSDNPGVFRIIENVSDDELAEVLIVQFSGHGAHHAAEQYFNWRSDQIWPESAPHGRQA